MAVEVNFLDDDFNFEELGLNASDLEMEGLLLNNQTISHVKLVETEMAEYLYLYVSPWLLFFGTIGNILAYVIMFKMSFRVWSTCMYLAVIPIVDLVLLYVQCGNHWIYYLTKQRVNISQLIMFSSNALCKVYIFLVNFTSHLSPWLVVAMLGECMLSLRFPKHTPRLCTREHTRAVMLLITVLLICVNIQYFWTHGLTKPTENPFPVCTFIREWSNAYRDTVWPTITTMIGHLAPLIVVLALCLTIALTYVRAVLSDNFRRSHTAKSEIMFRHFLDPIAFQEFQGTILTVGFAYILLMPPQLCLIIYRYILFNYQQVQYTFKLDAQLKLLEAITHTLHYIFLGTKFVIYYISSQRFQREFMKIIQLLCRPLKCCKNDKYGVKKVSIKKHKDVDSKDEQTTRLVLDGKCHVTAALDNDEGMNSHFRTSSITTDV